MELDINKLLQIITLFAALWALYMGSRKSGFDLRKVGAEAEKEAVGADKERVSTIQMYEQQVREMVEYRRQLEEEMTEMQLALVETQRRVAELELTNKALERRYEVWVKTIMGIVPSAILILNADTGAIIDANARSSSLYGYSRGALLQMNITDLSAEPEATFSVLINRATKVETRHHKRNGGKIFTITADLDYFQDVDARIAVAVVREVKQIPAG